MNSVEMKVDDMSSLRSSGRMLTELEKKRNRTECAEIGVARQMEPRVLEATKTAWLSFLNSTTFDRKSGFDMLVWALL